MPGMINGIKNVLFDLDGTLVDSSETIGRSVDYALKQLNSGQTYDIPVATYIGKPLLDIFLGEFGMTLDQAEKAIDDYREY